MSQRKTFGAVAAVLIAVAIAGCGRNDPAKFVASAETYIDQSNYSAAIIELKNALAGAPDNARARFLLGKSSLAAGDPRSASTELRKALALKYPAAEVYPLLAQAWVAQGAPRGELEEFTNVAVEDPKAKAEIANALASAYMSYGQRKEARAQVEAALAFDSTNAAAQVTQARLIAAEGNPAEGLKRINALLATAPKDLPALMLKSELEIASGQRSAAIGTLEGIVAGWPNAFTARYLLASSYIQTKEFDKAAAQVELMKKQAPNDARTFHAMALVAFSANDMPAALDAVQKSLQAAPEFMPSRYLSGLVDLRRGAYESAEQSLRSVIAKSPDDHGARVALSQTLLRRGNSAKAKEALDPVLRREIQDAGALRLAAEIELAMKRPAKAMEYIERANSLEDDNVRGRVRLAQIRLAKGETAQGIRDLEKLAAADKDQREPDAALISAHMRSRDYDKALAAADALIKKQPKSAFAHNAKGTVYAAKGDLKNARESYEKALSFEPGYVSALFNLASVDGIERKFADARKRYEQILAKDPKSERALLGLVQLQVAVNAPAGEIVAAIQRVVAANPQSVAARLTLVSFYGKQKDWKSAIVAGQAAQAAIPDSPQILEALAAAQVANGEKNQALETYARLAKLQPENTFPLMRMAGIYISLQNYDAAIASLKSAFAITPNNAAIWGALAGAYVQANKAEAGYAEARRWQKDLTSRTAGYALEAEILVLQKKYPEAVALYRTTMARNTNPLVVVRFHTLLSGTGKPDEAASVAQKWLAEHPKDVMVRAYLGQQSMAKGDLKTAATYLRAANEVEPNNVIVLNDLAWALAELKDPKATDYAQRAYRIAPTNPNIVNTYGWALVQRGDAVQGLQMLRKAVELDPGDANRRLYLAKALIQTGDKPAARTELEIVAKSTAVSARTQAEQLLKDL